MARTDLNIPSLGNNFLDIRDPIPGDSFNWSWTRPLSQVKYLAIHHTAGPDSQTPEEIANYHVNNNGWGGVGYHFLINRDGIVFYVGDISTARANVANLNDQVLGICLIGSFVGGKTPSSAQLDSANKLCDFFINNYPALVNVGSWDVVKGHKDLPGQATTCPGDNWPLWRANLVKGGNVSTPVQPDSGSDLSQREQKIAELYKIVLGRDADPGGLQRYATGPMSIDQVIFSMVTSDEHREILESAEEIENLKSQISNFQTSLTSINQQVITLQQIIQDKDQEINTLKQRTAVIEDKPATAPQPTLEPTPPPAKPDATLTIVQALFNLYKFVFMPGKVN